MYKYFNKKVLMSLLVMTILASATIGANAVTNVTNWTGNGDGSSWSDDNNWNNGGLRQDDQAYFNNSTFTDDLLTSNDFLDVRLDRVVFTGSGNGYGVGAFGQKILLNERIISDNTGANKTYNLVFNKIVANDNIVFTAKNNSVLGIIKLINTNKNKLTLQTAGNEAFIYLGNEVRIYGAGNVVVKGYGFGVLADKGARVEVKTTVNKGGYLDSNSTFSRMNVYADGTLQPDGCLNTGSLIVKDGTLRIYVSGNSGCSYGKVITTGKVDLRRGRLNLRVPDSFVPIKGEKYTIIRNDKADAVIGNFRGLPEGDTFRANGYRFKITYKGGTGNDVVLTRF